MRLTELLNASECQEGTEWSHSNEHSGSTACRASALPTESPIRFLLAPETVQAHQSRARTARLETYEVQLVKARGTGPRIRLMLVEADAREAAARTAEAQVPGYKVLLVRALH